MTPTGKGPEPGAPGQLYNLADDPGEMRDLWAERPDVVKELTSLLQRYRRDGRSVPLRRR